MTTCTMTVESLRQHELVILRRLRTNMLTEFELAAQVAEHSGYTPDQCAEKMPDWLVTLCRAGLIWAGQLVNDSRQRMWAAALTKNGRELVG